MSGITDLARLLKDMTPQLQQGEYVFCTVPDNQAIDIKDILGSFREEEGITLILSRETADRLQLSYTYIAAWITLKVHSSLSAVGLTAAFSSALGREGISCNVVAAFYHDHIFVAKEDAAKAIETLKGLTVNH
ncbi:ACT domain-containing protein [Chitinophaga pinensis]|uniref:ACT domain-containing protein n=1 Tax=Chitinophaga pinensis TaxID=79329 RepID=A0A5C6LNE7_9BACT|nr:ACT domain-containing protein [Chitinophaga pinensis]TWV95717.1 ACT domain-containing protein [Chitinophaga pinensis]